MHSERIVHNKIQCENLRYNKENNALKIIYNELFTVDSLQYTNQHTYLNLQKLAPQWAAPEIIEKRSNIFCNCKSDIWSLGITIIEMYKGIPPNYDKTHKAAIMQTLMNDNITQYIPTIFSIKLKHFLNQCLIKNIDLRANIYDLIKHPWILYYAYHAVLSFCMSFFMSYVFFLFLFFFLFVKYVKKKTKSLIVL